MAVYVENLSQRTADRLEALIVEKGEFGPGQKIPNEMELSELFCVSRTTLREAVKILAARRIVEIRRGTGTFVASVLPEKPSFDMPDMAQMITELHDLYEVRLLFEPQVAAVACKKATNQELAQLQELCDEMERLDAAGSDTTEDDIAFHSSLMLAAHNEFIKQLLPVIRRALSDRRVLDANARIQKKQTPDHHTLLDHSGIMKVMNARDPEAVRCAMYVHLSELLKEFDRYTTG